MPEWSYALAQHPMYLLMEEQGAVQLEAYIDRWQRSLDTLDRHPELKVGFDTSGIELERLAARRPALIERMRTLVRQGRLAFYNGTYAQPHLHHFGPEANYRQWAHGLATHRSLLGYDVTTHFVQEADVHEQLPQLLRAFGFHFALPPGFFYALEFQTPHELIGMTLQGLRFVHGEEFTTWVGLDQSEIPLYLAQVGAGGPPARERIALEQAVGLLHLPPILVDFPDMEELDEAWLANRRGVRFALLESALRERLAASPPRSLARLFTYWSYVEGVRAEELGRGNRRAEAAVLTAESLGALARVLTHRPADDLASLWKTILGAQHHDAYWVGAPRLRDRAIRWLAEAERQAAAVIGAASNAIAAVVDTSGLPDGTPLVVCNPYPAHTVEVADGVLPASGGEQSVEVCDEVGRVVPAHVETVQLPDGSRSCRVRFLADLPGLGYRSYAWHSSPHQSDSQPVGASIAIERPHYRAVVGPDGTFQSLLAGAQRLELLDADHRANVLRACTPDGVALPRAVAGPATLTASALAEVLRVAGTLGPDVDTDTELWFYRELPRIDVRLRLTFREAAIGDYFDDETKLNVLWPLGFDGAIHHDIPFGVVETRRDRPLFPISWVDISDGARGLVYFSKGTQRHRVQGRTLANVLAWGNLTDRFSARLRATPRASLFDLRLQGTHVIEYALYPHLGRWEGAEVVQAARRYQTPLPVVETGRHPGRLPPTLDVLQAGPANVVVTAVEAREQGLRLRLYESDGRETALKVQSDMLRVAALAALDGEPMEQLGPFRIAHLTLATAAE